MSAALLVLAACSAPDAAQPTLAPSPAPAAPPPSPTPTGAPTPTAPPSPAPSSGATPAPYCVVADVLTPVRDPARHAETALDLTHTVGPDYGPTDLVAIGGGQRFRGLAEPSLRALLDAAAAAGHRVVVVSAYRSYEEQKATFDHWVAVGGYERALRTSARAGHSEHQLGTAVDLGDGVTPPWEQEDWGATPAGAWVAANAERFGFVMSYPHGRESVTCYEYEPWHYRWVGPELAAELAAKLPAAGLTLREYQAGAR